MKNLTLMLLCGAMFVGLVFAESPSTMWSKQFTLNGKIDQPGSIFIDNSGNFLVNGTQDSAISSKRGLIPALCKISPYGEVIWLKVETNLIKGGSGFAQVASLSDGSSYLSTIDWESSGYYLTKRDPEGNVIWTKTTPYVSSLSVYKDTLVVLIIGADPKCQLRNADGEVVREFSLGINMQTAAPVVYKDFLYTVSYDGSGIKSGYSLLKLSLSESKLVWRRIIPDGAFVRSCATDTDGYVYVAGSKLTNDSTIGQIAHFIAKFDSDGNKIWEKLWYSRDTYDGNYQNFTTSVAVNSDKNLVVTGGFFQKGGVQDGLRTAYIRGFAISTGDSVWEKQWDYPEAKYVSQVFSLTFTTDCCLIVLGNSVSSSMGDPPNVIHLEKYSVDGVLEVKTPKQLPEIFSLEQNYPNPFNPTTTIRFALPGASNVVLKIYDALGREVSTLVNDQLTSGYHERQWNAGTLSSGIYFYRITAASTDGKKKFTESKKLLLMK